MAHYRIVEWARHQHYKDRDPPWIKLHRDLLTSETWVTLDDADRVLAIACMLVAAGTDNKIPADPKFIQRRAYLNSEPNFRSLVRVGFIEMVDDIGMVSNASIEEQPLASGTDCTSEAEAEAEAEERQRVEPQAAPLPLDEAVDAYNAEAEKAGWPKAQRITPSRRSALKARLGECGGLQGWHCAMAKAGESRFLTGKVPRGRGHENWRPDFDFFLKPTNFTKLMEGGYDDNRNGTANQNSSQRDGIAADFAYGSDLLRDKHYDGF